MSDAKVSFHTAASYRGFIYAIGTSSFDPDHRFFRRTAIDVPEYAGDIKRIPDDEENVTPGKDDPDTPSQDNNSESDYPESDASENTPVTTKPSGAAYTPNPSAAYVTIAPKTGDHDPAAMWTAIAAATSFAMISLVLLRKKTGYHRE